MSALPTIAAPETAAQLPMECTACGSKMETRPNPYFGKGLATHRTVALCKGCFRVAFVPEPAVDEEAASAGKIAGKVRGFFARAA
ncbi:hypothetical protein [Salinibacterium sp. ZJ454]|uniref:hypothetical protein n=1 Tax=Salinibacterium sp. ZJ454 TaxID=2708339 RepID=UPI00141FACB9|nr:hypothetical protein [Salinibacterium sp. ZJ454]